MPDQPIAARHLRPGTAQVLVVTGLAIGLAVTVAAEPRDAAVARWCVDAMIVVTFAGAVAAGRRRQHRRTGAWLAASASSARGWRREPVPALGVVIWCGLVASFGIADGVSFAAQRADLPTLSRAIGEVTSFGAGRGVVAVAWVAWGGWVALGWRWVRR